MPSGISGAALPITGPPCAPSGRKSDVISYRPAVSRILAESSLAGAEARIAAAGLDSDYRQAGKVLARTAAGSLAQEPVRRGRALRAESMEGVDSLSGGRRVGDRQRRDRAGQPPYRDRPRQLDVLRQ